MNHPRRIRARIDIRRAFACARHVALALAGIVWLASSTAADEVEIRRLPDLRFGRAAHTITALPDGRCLVTGGFTVQPHPVAAAELIEPTSGTSEAIGPMRIPRYGHTASLLPDGNVLIAGGWDRSGAVLDSAELFVPATKEFHPLPPMHQARAGHVAVVLTDGRLLLIGGAGRGREFVSSAEIFDPQSGRFAPVGQMREPRENHAAIRLADGRVLVCGGHHGRRAATQILTSAEIFDPRTNRFTPTGSLGSRRHKHDAVLLLDGRVLITGGASHADEPIVTTEFYDPTSGTFAPGPRLHRSRFKHAGTSFALSDGTVLVLGGSNRAERFWPHANRFELLSPSLLADAESYAAAALCPNGTILLSGGYGESIRGHQAAWLIRPARSAPH